MTPCEVSDHLAWLDSLEFFGIKLGLDQTRELFHLLGDPHERLRFVHVAGSNGKGSVCALLEAALRHAGFKTGFYSSPHLVKTGERFKINGVSASDETVAEYAARIRPAAEIMAAHDSRITYFEAATAIAALMFADAGTDIVLWEVGMGGRLDSTNIVTPLVSAITGISMEHADRLGGTLAKIAFEKAGIIKPGIPAFCARSTPAEALDEIRARAEERRAPFALAERIDETFPPEIRFKPDRSGAIQRFRLVNGVRLETPLMGVHQRHNAALAYSVLEYLGPLLHFQPETAAAGFSATCWAARFQLFPGQNLIVDAAHNPEGAQVLASTLRELFPGRKFHFLFGAFSDKDTAGGLAALAPLALSFRWIHMETRRASRTPNEFSVQLRTLAPGIPCDAMPLADALHTPFPDDAPRVLCGSLHLCGEALPLIAPDTLF